MIRKVWTIAKREYGAMVVTKAFLISIALMPVLMFGSIFFASRMENMGDVTDKTIVIVDGSGGALAADLKHAAAEHNALVTSSGSEPQLATARYIIEPHPADELTDEDRLALSDRVRSEEIKAFVEIPPGILSSNVASGPPPAVNFYAQNAMLSQERGWIEQTLNGAVTTRRLESLQLNVEAVKQATAPVPVNPLGLVKKSADGTIRGAEDGRSLAGIFAPLGFMMMMFMVIFMSAQPLLESVMEEKAGRIAEVLLGSVNASQLMLGKLLGNVAGSLSVMAIYAAGAYLVAAYKGWTDWIPLDMAPWFLIYQVLAVLLFSSIFMAVGAAVNQLKEAQSMLLPVWLVLVSPMFVWLQIVREPNGTLARWMSFFPPATPLVMVLRQASGAVIPTWQVVASLVLLVVATLLCVFIAGRVFRVGLLWQGKSPRFRELLAWAWRG
jgi:ABC-2 type transport system permease protein